LMKSSALQRAENSSIQRSTHCFRQSTALSVLFSEPKIPQSFVGDIQATKLLSFSALQRAENSSIFVNVFYFRRTGLSFSALQRAENSSIEGDQRCQKPAGMSFQCSSASRKFLNCRLGAGSAGRSGLSVLFSEPKIPQFWQRNGSGAVIAAFSALQRAENSSISGWQTLTRAFFSSFSALQRAENSSIEDDVL